MGSGAFKRILWYLIASTRGGPTRAKMLDALRKNPMNANQLAKNLKVDYRTVQHHIKILVNHRILTVVNKDSYGAVYFLSDELEQNILLFEQIWDKIRK
jgi:DNA-binding transcriptional ArsR family regulator